MEHRFDADRSILDQQYEKTEWQAGSGLSPEELEKKVLALEEALAGHSKSYIKAKTFEYLCRKGQIAALPADIFPASLRGSRP